MNWTASILIAVLTAAFGLLAAGLIANAAAGWHRISSFEGQAGYFVVMTALIGGVAGLVIGLICGRLMGGAGAAGAAGGPAFLKGLGLSFAVTGGIAGLAALLAWSLADVPPEIDGVPLDLEVEIRLPAADMEPPASRSGEAVITLGSVAGRTQRASRNGEVDLAGSRLEEGRWIVPATVPLFTMRGKRMIAMDLGGKPVAGFFVPLPRRPGPRFEEWSDWFPRPPIGSPAWPDSMPSYRFRIQRRIPLLPPRESGRRRDG